MGITTATVERKTRAGFFSSAVKNKTGHWEIGTEEVLEVLLRQV